MIVIRFQRRGKKNRPFFKMVLAEKESPPKGKFLEILGSYDPFTKERIINADRVHYWIGRGATVSPSVHNLLLRERVIAGGKIAVHAAGSKKKTDESGPAAPSPEKPSSQVESKEAFKAAQTPSEGESSAAGESGEGKTE